MEKSVKKSYQPPKMTVFAKIEDMVKPELSVS